MTLCSLSWADQVDDFFIAVNKNDLTSIESLINDGVDVNSKDESGDSALHKAVELGNLELAKLLVDKGANVNITDQDNATPLHWCATFHRPEIAKLLLENGANVNAEDNSSWTPLHDAVETNDGSMVKLLLEKGADKSITSKHGQTPLDLAKSDEIYEAFGEKPPVKDSTNEVETEENKNFLKVGNGDDPEKQPSTLKALYLDWVEAKKIERKEYYEWRKARAEANKKYRLWKKAHYKALKQQRYIEWKRAQAQAKYKKSLWLQARRAYRAALLKQSPNRQRLRRINNVRYWSYLKARSTMIAKYRAWKAMK